MMPNWTPQQHTAIYDRGKSLLVSAAAGSGKTAVLVERIISLIREGEDLEHMLVVTFTNAAASEMRERVRDGLERALREEGENAHLLAQLEAIGRADISTIHRFCGELLRRYFHLVGIDPGFRILEQPEADLMAGEAVEAAFEEEYEQATTRFYNLLDSFSATGDDAPAREAVLRLYRFARSDPDPQGYLQRALENYSLKEADFAASPFGSELKSAAVEMLRGACSALWPCVEMSKAPGAPEKYAAYFETHYTLFVQAAEQLEQLDMAQGAALLAGLGFGRLPARRKGDDEALCEAIKKRRGAAQKLLAQAQKQLTPPEGGYTAGLERAGELAYELVYLTQSFAARYAQAKQERGVLDFSDLEHEALRCLRAGAAQECARQYAYIFVDEYQDSNLLQETLLSTFAREDNCFYVGDVKQSIYRFRLAEPGLFLEKYQRYADGGAQQMRIDLNRNFRSRPEVLEAVNTVFERIMQEGPGGLNYGAAERLYPGREAVQPSIRAELHLLSPRKEMEGEPEALAEARQVQLEARAVAARVAALLGEEIPDGAGGTRRICPGDIAILLRTVHNQEKEFLDALSEAGVPAWSEGGAGLFEAPEVSAFLALLKCIDNRRQDVPLLSALRGPAGGFELEALCALRLRYPGTRYFFEACLEAANDAESGEEGQKMREFFARLDAWRARLHTMGLGDFMDYLIEDSGFMAGTLTLQDGARRLQNLRQIAGQARSYGAHMGNHLDGFLATCENLRTGGESMGAVLLPQGEQVVRVMSIHKSKGLEFPVAIVAGLGRRMNRRDTTAPLLMDRALGFGLRDYDAQKRLFGPTVIRRAIASRTGREAVREEMRVLYVAMTRARERLLLFGSTGGMEETLSRWCNAGDYAAQARQAKSLLDMVGPVALSPEGEAAFAVTCHREMEGFEAPAIAQSPLYEEPEADAASKQVLRQLSWRYPYAQATATPSKLTVSQVRFKEGAGEVRFAPQPRFMEGERQITPLQRGTLTHRMCQLMDLKRAHSLKDLEAQLQDFVARRFFSKEEAKAISLPWIWRFLQSDIGRRMAAAQVLHREIPFSLSIPARELFEETEHGEGVVVQGIIDACFMENGSWILLDYKTDYLPFGEMAAFKRRYGPQLDVYARALGTLTGKPVSKGYLYLLRSGDCIEMPLGTFLG